MLWNNFTDLFLHVKKSYNNPTCLNFVENGKWRFLSTPEVMEEIKNVALGLKALGLKKGACVGLMALPSPRWTIVNFGVILAGGILVPLFPNLSSENFLLEVKETEQKIIFHEKNPLVEAHRDLFEHVLSLNDDQLLGSGKEYEKEHPLAFQELLGAIKDDELAAIIYTSSTTGLPKGVELTQRNLIRHLCNHPFEIGKDTRYLSILPLAHILGFCLNLILFGYGSSIYYSNDVKKLGDACREIHPTMLVVVPRLLEKLYAKMELKVHEAGFMKRHIGEWAFALAKEEEDSLIKKLVHPLVDKLVYTHLREALGGSIEAVISGGAPLNPHLNHFFKEVGIPIFEGWGLTEGCPITVNSKEANKIGTVGRPFKEIELKISPQGEVLVRGTLVMRGYYKREKETRETLDSEGWLHTGDKGEIDEEGYLKLQGRLKELFKTSTGEWVSPVPIEQMVCKAPLVEMAMVIAEGKKYVTCLLFANNEVLDSLKRSKNASNLTDEQFLQSEFVTSEMEKLISSINEHLNHWEEIRAYSFVAHPPSIEAGELTPSMKLRRGVIMNKYKHLIDAMYSEEAKV